MSEPYYIPLGETVGEVREITAAMKDATLPYVGLEHIESGSLKISRVATAGSSIGVNSKFEVGDILFGKLRPALRKCIQAPFAGYCSTDILVLRALEGVDPRFAAWAMSSDRVFSRAIRDSEGTRMPRTSWRQLCRLRIFVPPVLEQQRIAEVLDAVENGIDKIRHCIEKLIIVADLEVDKLIWGIDSTIESLGSQLVEEPRNGYSPQGVDEWTGTVALGLGCLTRNGFRPTDLKNVPAGDSRAMSALLSDGELLMSRSNTPDLVGLVGRYREVGVPCIYPDLMMRLVVRTGYRSDFLELVLRTRRMRQKIQALAQGTSGSMVKINSDSVKSLPVPVPTTEEQERVIAVSQMWRDMVCREEAELDKLRLLKAGLMDDLLTGKVRVTRSGELTG